MGSGFPWLKWRGLIRIDLLKSGICLLKFISSGKGWPKGNHTLPLVNFKNLIETKLFATHAFVFFVFFFSDVLTGPLFLPLISLNRICPATHNATASCTCSKTFHTQPKRRSLAAAPFCRVVGRLQFCHSWWWFKPGKIHLKMYKIW